jgi:hypothetical protein
MGAIYGPSSASARAILSWMVETADEAVQRTFAWFEVNSGWAPPEHDTLLEWIADGVCRCPDDCIVAPDAWCEHGLASWWLINGALDRLDEQARTERRARRGSGAVPRDR